MLRLVRLSYPNSIRGDLFTEFAMETAHDSIKYIMPIYTKDSGEFGGEGQHNKMDLKYDGTFGADGYGDVMYESAESRYATEMVEATVGEGSTTTFDITAPAGMNIVDGYAELYDVNGKLIAIQAGRNHEWLIDKTVVAGTGDSAHVQSITFSENAYHVTTDGTLTATTGMKALVRIDTDADLQGDYLGEVELTMKDYQFKPRALELGVTWTQLTELILDTSFGVSAEETLMDAASQEIKKTLDFQAIKYANAIQRMNGIETVTFNADPSDKGGIKDSYWHTAQNVLQAVDAVGNNMLDKIMRGGVTSIVGGPKAVTYLKLNEKWSDTGRQPAIGGHKVGELDGIPVYKVPGNIVANDELLTVWKNEQNEADVAIAIGTLLPFYSTGAIQRKNLYKEAAVARFEDTQALQKDYIGRIKIDGIR